MLDPSDRGRLLTNVSIAKAVAFDATNDPARINDAVRGLREAVLLSPPRTLDNAIRLAQLCAAVLTAAEHGLADIDEAVDAGAAAVAVLPEDHPQSCTARYNAGRS